MSEQDSNSSEKQPSTSELFMSTLKGYGLGCVTMLTGGGSILAGGYIYLQERASQTPPEGFPLWIPLEVIGLSIFALGAKRWRDLIKDSVYDHDDPKNPHK